MSYIGADGSYGSFDKQLLTGDGTNATFDLSYAVAQPGQLLVSIDGIIQEPEYSYSISIVSGNPKITFASAPVNNARIFVVYLGRQTTANVYAQASPHIDEFDGDNSAQQFTLSQTPASNEAGNFMVFVDNVYQRYGSGLAYTVTGATLNFSSPPPTGTKNIQVIQLSRANTLNTVAAGQLSAINDDATALAIALG